MSAMKRRTKKQKILAFLAKHPNSTAAEIATALKYITGYVHPALYELRKKGEISVSAHRSRKEGCRYSVAGCQSKAGADIDWSKTFAKTAPPASEKFVKQTSNELVRDIDGLLEYERDRLESELRRVNAALAALRSE